MLSIDSAMGDDIVCGVKILQEKYCLVAGGLMLNPEIEHIVKSLLKDINFIFNDLMTYCIDLTDEDTWILYMIPNGHNPEWHHPEWTQSRMDTIPNGHNPEWHHPEWTQSRMGTIPNGHNPEWTPFRMSTYSYIVTLVFYSYCLVRSLLRETRI